MIALSGVRSSWLTLAKNSVFIWLALTAVSRAAESASRAWRNSMRPLTSA